MKENTNQEKSNTQHQENKPSESGIENQAGKIGIMVHQEDYRGPLPPPAMLEKYKRIYAQAPEIILKEFQENSRHIREREMEALRGTIERDKQGQWMAFCVCISMLGIVAYSLYLGNITFAGLSGLGFIAIIIKGFLRK